MVRCRALWLPSTPIWRLYWEWVELYPQLYQKRSLHRKWSNWPIVSLDTCPISRQTRKQAIRVNLTMPRQVKVRSHGTNSYTGIMAARQEKSSASASLRIVYLRVAHFGNVMRMVYLCSDATPLSTAPLIGMLRSSPTSHWLAQSQQACLLTPASHQSVSIPRTFRHEDMTGDQSRALATYLLTSPTDWLITRYFWEWTLQGVDSRVKSLP